MIDPVVDATWLSAHRRDVVVADVRWYLDGRSGRAAYDTGHIPGAVFVDLDRWLAAPATPEAGRHPLPDPAVFAEGMSSLGIADDDVVIAYDDAGGVIAARLVWMLRATGHEAAILDGGLQAFDGPLDTRDPARPRVPFAETPWPPERLATIDDASDPSFAVIDARDLDRYQGDAEPVDPRAGHIPGARSLPCRGHLWPDGLLLPLEILRERFAAAGVTADRDAISYCGSGVTACHNLIVQEHAGLGLGRLYPGSWSQYSATDRPAATGPEPG